MLTITVISIRCLQLLNQRKITLLQENRRVSAQLCQGSVRVLKSTKIKAEAGVIPGKGNSCCRE